jgi:hypothetical protein
MLYVVSFEIFALKTEGVFFFLKWLKGIVSRDLHICFWYHSIDLKFLHLMEPFVYFLNFVFVSNFFNFAFQLGELTLPQSGAERQDFYYGVSIGN